MCVCVCVCVCVLCVFFFFTVNDSNNLKLESLMTCWLIHVSINLFAKNYKNIPNIHVIAIFAGSPWTDGQVHYRALFKSQPFVPSTFLQVILHMCKISSGYLFSIKTFYSI